MTPPTAHLAGLDTALAHVLAAVAPTRARQIRASVAALRRAPLTAPWNSPTGAATWLHQLTTERLSPDTIAAYSSAANRLLAAAGAPTQLPVAPTHRRSRLHPRDQDRVLAILEADVDTHPPGSPNHQSAARGVAVAGCIRDTGTYVGTLNAARLDDLDLPAATLTLTDRRPGRRHDPPPHPYPLTPFTLRAVLRWLPIRHDLTAGARVGSLWVTLCGSAGAPSGRRRAGLPVLQPATLAAHYLRALQRLHDDIPGTGLPRELHPTRP